MSRAAVEQLLRLMDGAFTGAPDDPHSLLANLRTVGPDDWDWRPHGGRRSIFDIARHVGECYYVYDSHAFGDAAVRWDRPATVPTIGNEAPIPDALGWLREGHRRFRDHVAALSDEDLTRPGRVGWHSGKDLRGIIALMVEHDLYHAGEINHIRALHQANDAWNPESPWADAPR